MYSARTTVAMHMPRSLISVFLGLTCCAVGACSPERMARQALSDGELRQRAMECLKCSLSDSSNVVVRVQAVEALQECATDEELPWIRSALQDESAAVRFAACMAVGTRRDETAEESVRRCVRDEDPSVRVAALYAMHRLGRTEQTARIAAQLLAPLDELHAPSRRHAALILGMLGEPSAVRVLARAMKDPDPGVRQHALEAMARLGNKEARQELTFMTCSGVGSDEVFALRALSQVKDPALIDTLRYKLRTAAHREIQLAAAEGLGMYGIDEGYPVAMESLTTTRVSANDPGDPPREQLLRIRQLAATALSTIGRREAMPRLAACFEKESDPRLRISIARAILRILRTRGDASSPDPSTSKHELEHAVRTVSHLRGLFDSESARNREPIRGNSHCLD